MISLRTIAPTGFATAPVQYTVMVLVKLLRRLPWTSYAVKVKKLLGELSGMSSVQFETDVQMMGYSIPLTRSEAAWTGAVPVSVSRLLLVVIGLGPLTEKAALPPAELISFRAALVRCEI